jgi:tRNA(fMet)-specific endonuclease VapC
VKYLLDTNAVIKILNGDAKFVRRVQAGRAEDIGLPAIVMHELYFGAFHGRQTNKTIAIIERLAFDVVDFRIDDARCAAETRAKLAAAGTPIGPFDVLIAGQALARDLTLITHNTREFSRVAGLRVEDWEA